MVPQNVVDAWAHELYTAAGGTKPWAAMTDAERATAHKLAAVVVAERERCAGIVEAHASTLAAQIRGA